MGRQAIARVNGSESRSATKATRLLHGLAIAAFVLTAGGTAQAQQGTSVLQGTVFDHATKRPLPEVIVMVKSPALQEEQVTVTDSSGYYRVPSLPPGVYSIHFEGNGYFPNAQA